MYRSGVRRSDSFRDPGNWSRTELEPHVLFPFLLIFFKQMTLISVVFEKFLVTHLVKKFLVFMVGHHHRLYKNPPLDPILNLFNPVYTTRTLLILSARISQVFCMLFKSC
jgi:hypothetical protein